MISLDDIDLNSLANRLLPLMGRDVQNVTVPVGSEVSVASTGNTYNVASLSLAPGTYLLWGTVDFALAAATTTKQQLGISLTSATLAGQTASGGLGPDATVTNQIVLTTSTSTLNDTVGPVSLTLTATTTVYLVASAAFSAGAVSVYGTLYCLQL